VCVGGACAAQLTATTLSRALRATVDDAATRSLRDALSVGALGSVRG
jgi:hypothetical protein